PCASSPTAGGCTPSSCWARAARPTRPTSPRCSTRSRPPRTSRTRGPGGRPSRGKSPEPPAIPLARRRPGLIHCQYPTQGPRRGSWFRPLQRDPHTTLARRVRTMFGLGGQEMLILLILGVLLFGKKLPDVGRSLGKGLVEFKKGL